MNRNLPLMFLIKTNACWKTVAEGGGLHTPPKFHNSAFAPPDPLLSPP